MFGKLFGDVIDLAVAPIKPVVRTARKVQKEVCETVDDVVGLDKGTTETVAEVATIVTTGVDLLD